MNYTLPKLQYPYDVLEPYIDAKTMEIHYRKHHQAYVDNLNKILANYPQIADEKLEDLMRKLSTVQIDDKDRVLLKNHGGGHLNHSFFWTIMAPKKEIDEDLVTDIKKEFGTLEEFRKIFSEAATKHFGSGWAWLVRDTGGELQVYSLPNQDSPYLQNHIPLIGLDLWEHAYYLKYQNRRVEYIANWWNILKLI